MESDANMQGAPGNNASANQPQPGPNIGVPRQYEMLSPAFMEQFSSKADLYDYLKNHLQVSDPVLT